MYIGALFAFLFYGSVWRSLPIIFLYPLIEVTIGHVGAKKLGEFMLSSPSGEKPPGDIQGLLAQKKLGVNCAIMGILDFLDSLVIFLINVLCIYYVDS